MILGVFPELMSAGGIQVIGRHTAAALSSIAQDRNHLCQLLSLNDPIGFHELRVGGSVLTFQGFGRRKGRLVRAVLAAAPRTDIAYIGHPYMAPLGLLIRLFRPNAHYWVAAYGIDVWEPLSPLRRLALRSAHALIALSKYTGEMLVTIQKLRPGMVEVLPPAIDPGFVRNDSSKTRSMPPVPSGRILLTVARLDASEQYKGIETIIQALPTVLRVVPNTYHVVVGDGDDRPRLEFLAREKGIAGHVLFVGEKIGDELVSYYDACDIFVMPSRAEGFGVVFLEAMILGKPVVGGNHGGTPEVVKDGETGFLVEYGDVEAVADCLIRLLKDNKMCKRMGEAGRRRVEEDYTFEHFHRGLARILTEG